ncbi:MAG: hemerythrin domain-containing protein [Devosia nanyangense]|uniref:Hemerythrin domain-containing protein n=1 Tax=Devosia nanyangense TaxID=1228055 RepID=A0A933L5Y5_9HYPH|nr:hemerythrin domain-containing protein [Devosia nanyangense]
MILDIAFLDDATRPTAPRLEGLTASQRAAGEHLREVHDHLRENMRVIRDLIQLASEGHASPAEVAEQTAGLTMLDNFRRFGNLCGRYCMVVNTHHSLEDQHVFPALAAQSDGYRRVTERLQAEHVVVHDLLERQIEALNILAGAPTAEHFDNARTIFAALERVLGSHLGYEEDQIGDALGYFNIF